MESTQSCSNLEHLCIIWTCYFFRCLIVTFALLLVLKCGKVWPRVSSCYPFPTGGGGRSEVSRIAEDLSEISTFTYIVTEWLEQLLLVTPTDLPTLGDTYLKRFAKCWSNTVAAMLSNWIGELSTLMPIKARSTRCMLGHSISGKKPVCRRREQLNFGAATEGIGEPNKQITLHRPPLFAKWVLCGQNFFSQTREGKEESSNEIPLNLWSNILDWWVVDYLSLISGPLFPFFAALRWANKAWNWIVGPQHGRAKILTRGWERLRTEDLTLEWKYSNIPMFKYINFLVTIFVPAGQNLKLWPGRPVVCVLLTRQSPQLAKRRQAFFAPCGSIDHATCSIGVMDLWRPFYTVSLMFGAETIEGRNLREKWAITAKKEEEKERALDWRPFTLSLTKLLVCGAPRT